MKFGQQSSWAGLESLSSLGRQLGQGVSLACLVGLGLVSGVSLAPNMSEASQASSQSAKEQKMSFFGLSAKNIDGKDVQLGDYQGKVVLVVNVASKCGFTGQYAGLEKLWDSYKDKGLVVLGFPSNEFGGQEPGTEAEIKQFCSLKYNVSFPMFSKVEVKKGSAQSPIYSFLTQKYDAPAWNFTKYLVGKDGQVIQSFGSRVSPDSDELIKAIEAAL